MSQFWRLLVLSEGSFFLYGLASGIITMRVYRFLLRVSLRKPVETAFISCRLVCEPEIVDPKTPGHPPAWPSQAREKVNTLRGRLEKAGFVPPQLCDESKERIAEWFDFLGKVRSAIAKKGLLF